MRDYPPSPSQARTLSPPQAPPPCPHGERAPLPLAHTYPPGPLPPPPSHLAHSSEYRLSAVNDSDNLRIPRGFRLGKRLPF
jgi:hypothetical protein